MYVRTVDEEEMTACVLGRRGRIVPNNSVNVLGSGHQQVERLEFWLGFAVV